MALSTFLVSSYVVAPIDSTANLAAGIVQRLMPNLAILP